MAEQKITGAIAFPSGAVYRAGQEKELAEAAAAAGLDLGAERFAGHLTGDWTTPIAPVPTAPVPAASAPKAEKAATDAKTTKPKS